MIVVFKDEKTGPLIGLRSFQNRIRYIGRKGANYESILPDQRGVIYNERLEIVDFRERRRIYEDARMISRIGVLYHRHIVFSPRDFDMDPGVLKEIVKATMDDFKMESLKKDTRYVFSIHRHGKKGTPIPPIRTHAHVILWAPTVEGVGASRATMKRLVRVASDLETVFTGGVLV